MRLLNIKACLKNEVIIVLVLLIIFGFWAVLLGQDANWDLKDYHYYNPYAFLHYKDIFTRNIAPAQLQTFFNPFLDFSNYFIITYAPGSRVAEFLLGTFHGIAVYFLFKITQYLIRVENPLLCNCYIILGLLLGVTGAASISQLGTTYNESQLSVFVMAATFLALKFINNPDQKQVYFFLLAAGLILGLSTGLKTTAISYSIAFFGALLFYQKPNLKQIKLIFVSGTIFCLGFLITSGYWMWVLYQHFQNPLFPYYNNIFHSHYSSFTNFAAPKTLTVTLLYPFYLLHNNKLPGAIRVVDARLAISIVLGFLFICYLGYQKLVTKKSKGVTNITPEILSVRFVCLFFYFSYFIWVFQFGEYRFTIPLNFLSGILITYFFIQLGKPSFLHFFILATLSLLIMFTTHYPNRWTSSYHKHFFEVQVPVIPSNSMVILAGASPVAYLIPFFPPDTRFVALLSYFVSDGNPYFLQQTLDAIKNHRGPLYVLVDSTDPANPQIDFKARQKEVLKLYGLARLDERCVSVISNMEPAPIPLCAVVKINNK